MDENELVRGEMTDDLEPIADSWEWINLRRRLCEPGLFGEAIYY